MEKILSAIIGAMLIWIGGYLIGRSSQMENDMEVIIKVILIWNTILTIAVMWLLDNERGE